MDNRPGRKTKLTSETIAIIADLLIAGCTNKQVCEAVGISQQTFCVWMRSNVGFRLVVEKSKRAHLERTSPARQQWEAQQKIIAELEAAFLN